MKVYLVVKKINNVVVDYSRKVYTSSMFAQQLCDNLNLVDRPIKTWFVEELVIDTTVTAEELFSNN